MKTAMGMLCIAASVVLFWIAFHDIENYLDPDGSTSAHPTITDIFRLVKNQTLGS